MKLQCPLAEITDHKKKSKKNLLMISSKKAEFANGIGSFANCSKNPAKKLANLKSVCCEFNRAKPHINKRGKKETLYTN